MKKSTLYIVYIVYYHSSMNSNLMISSILILASFVFVLLPKILDFFVTNGRTQIEVIDTITKWSKFKVNISKDLTL